MSWYGERYKDVHTGKRTIDLNMWGVLAFFGAATAYGLLLGAIIWWR